VQLNAFLDLAKCLPAGRQENLVIVGSYEKSKHFLEYANFCKKTKPKNVKIKSWVADKELKKLYAGCKGLLATSIDEDFGMSVVEAMASGKPVIAANEGGYKETIVNKKTGLLIDEINHKKLAEVIQKTSQKLNKNPLLFKQKCQKRAKQFDTEIFIKKIKKILTS
jgi:glycosyltransferase involved in cell wall biosynthesis